MSGINEETALEITTEPKNDSGTEHKRTLTGQKKVVGLLACLFVIGSVALFWPEIRLKSFVVVIGKQVSPSDQVSISRISHDDWDELLQKYVSKDGLVNYRDWLTSESDLQKLDNYLDQLAQADPQTPVNKEQKLAFWINAYNALTVKGILREYPTTSIRNHTGAIGYNIWDHLSLRVGNQPYSLTAIEHEILGKIEEPRIHFAIVYASIGCPRLLNEAFVASRLDEQLDGNAKHFFTQERNFRIEPKSRTVHLSSILNWFATDFGPDQAAQLARIKPFLSTV